MWCERENLSWGVARYYWPVGMCVWLSCLLTDAGLFSLWAAPFLGHVVLGCIKVMKHGSASKPMSNPARSSPPQSLPLVFWMTSCPHFPQRWTVIWKYKPNSPAPHILLLVWIFNYSMRSQTSASGEWPKKTHSTNLGLPQACANIHTSFPALTCISTLIDVHTHVHTPCIHLLKKFFNIQ